MSEMEIAAPETASTKVSDAAAREDAWNVEQSWIVEAPAGSGKTELLMQRFLRLLGRVDQPEQVLAITFTRKAAAEMRDRVLESIHAAHALPKEPLTEPHKQKTREFALETLARDARMGWNLISQPWRLNIRTIDSFCGEIASRLPALSRMGGYAAPVDDASELYRQAALATVEELGGNDARLREAARTLLLHAGNKMDRVVDLLAEMLATRDHWGEPFLVDKDRSDEELDELIRELFEKPLRETVQHTLDRAHDCLPLDMWQEIFVLAHFAAGVLESEGRENRLRECMDSPEVPPCGPECAEVWKAAARLLLTQDGELRKPKGININVGFPSKTPEKARVQALLDSCERLSLDDIAVLAALPPTGYTDQQRKVLRASFQLLRRALGHLKLAFAAAGKTDFIEVSLTALQALKEESDSVLLAFGTTLQHLLVDEMQDTSVPQFEMLSELVKGWDGHSQTVFLVGDPKQSIYRFRHLDVRLFTRAREEGLGGVPLEPIRLIANFRSTQSFVKSTNEAFTPIFADPDVDCIQYEPSEAGCHSQGDGPAATCVLWHPRLRQDGQAGSGIEAREESPQEAEAREICEIIERLRAEADPGKKLPSIAVLVRARNHAGAILRQMRERGIPYRALEMDRMGERQPLIDLVSITRAILHPADRIAWLATLRAPWCGLTLKDLLTLCGNDDPSWADKTVPQLFDERAELLSPDGRRRAQRAVQILSAACAKVTREPLSGTVERAWSALGGPDCVAKSEAKAIADYFQMLDQLEQESGSVSASQIEERMDNRFATITEGDAPVEVLTLFKAKGLEWDVVFLPGLDRTPKNNSAALIEWMEQTDDAPIGGADSLLPIILAPMKGDAEEEEPIGTWIRDQEAKRDHAELKRIFYVGWTRARRELHLFGRYRLNKGGDLRLPAKSSLLRAAWPAAELEFVRHRQASANSAGTGNLIAMPVAANGPDGTVDATIPGDLDSVAAGAAEEMPSTVRLKNFVRLVEDWSPPPITADVPFAASDESVEWEPDSPAFARPQGSWRARLFGTGVHTFLPVLAEILAQHEDGDSAVRALESMDGSIRLQLARAGVPMREAAAEVRRILAALKTAAHDREGRWILAPHPQPIAGAVSSPAPGFEVPLTGQIQNVTRSVRVDRMFLAGDAPLDEGDGCLWIVDFKTASYGSGLQETAQLKRFLDAEKRQYAAQMETYAAIARTVCPSFPKIRLGLYYPLLPRLLWWRHEE